MTSKKQRPNPSTLTPSWDLYTRSFQLMREHYVAIIYLVLLPSLVNVLGSLMVGNLQNVVDGGVPTDRQLQGFGIMLIGGVWAAVNIGPLNYYLLKTLKGKAVSLREAYTKGLPYTLRTIAYMIGFSIMLIGGLILFIVPGLIVLRRYILGQYYLLDQKTTIRQAFSRSAETSVTYKSAMWGTIGVLAFLAVGAQFTSNVLMPVGYVVAQLIACSYTYLAALRYHEIEHPQAS